jgi:hypothetical protein
MVERVPGKRDVERSRPKPLQRSSPRQAIGGTGGSMPASRRIRAYSAASGSVAVRLKVFSGCLVPSAVSGPAPTPMMETVFSGTRSACSRADHASGIRVSPQPVVVVIDHAIRKHLLPELDLSLETALPDPPGISAPDQGRPRPAIYSPRGAEPLAQPSQPAEHSTES